jgi:hypothetical protein
MKKVILKKIKTGICISDMPELILLHRAILSVKEHHQVVFNVRPYNRDEVLNLTSIAKEWRKEVISQLDGELPLFNIETKNFILTINGVVIVKTKNASNLIRKYFHTHKSDEDIM